jgi:hypothetical protein
MSVEDTGVVDFISLDPSATEVELTISDHLDWTDSERHVELLQRKIHRYLDFIESGGLRQSYPSAADKPIVIRVRAKFSPAPAASRFFEFIQAIAQENGVKVRFVAPDDQ